jgi:hypothetical protein
MDNFALSCGGRLGGCVSLLFIVIIKYCENNLKEEKIYLSSQLQKF